MNDKPEVTRHRVGKSRQWADIAMIALGLAVVVGLGIFYTNQVDRQNRRDWCALIVEFDNAYRESSTPPATETGRRIARLMHERRQTLECD